MLCFLVSLTAVRFAVGTIVYVPFPRVIPMVHWSRFVVAILVGHGLILSSLCSDTQAASKGSLHAAFESIRDSDLKRHAFVLASDDFEGREAGTQGGKAAADYLVDRLREMNVAPGGPDGDFFQEFGEGYRNVLALFPGSDPDKKDEFLVVGGHYDHVGYGTQRNSRGTVGLIHNGADDNASGTVGLLEIIEAFTILNVSPRRSVLFAFWDAEEKNLLGSEHWVRDPTVAVEQIRLVFTADMIGRMRNQTVKVFGTRTAPGLRRFASEQNRGIGIRIEFPWRMKRDSDHFPFFQQGIPSMLLHTGTHEDYHRPSDDADRLNFSGLQEVSRLLFSMVIDAADADELPAFRPNSADEDTASQKKIEEPLAAPPSRLGGTWDEDLTGQGIIQLTDVPAGSPAWRAGLQAGDQILQFAGQSVDDFTDFRTLLVTADREVEAVVEREGLSAPLHVTVTLDGDPLRVGFTWRMDDAEPDCVILTQVIPGSPAHLAGLQPNDRVYSVDGQSFSTSEEFHALATTRPGPLSLSVERNGRIRPVPIRLLSDLRQHRDSAEQDSE